MSEMKKRILITGGAGFVGYHLAFRLSQNPLHDIVIVDNFIRGKLDREFDTTLKQPNIKCIFGDLTDKETYKHLGSNFDEVYHFAAIIGVKNVLSHPHEVLRVNSISLLFLLDWFVNGGGSKLLFASTSEVYAWTQHFHQLPIPTPEDVPLSLNSLYNPRSTYAGSKIFGELAVTQYCTVFRKPFVIMRYHNVYGPRMGFEHVIPELYFRVVNGQDPLIVYSADHIRAFCYISDAIEATISAMREEVACGLTFNVGNDEEEITIGELARRILKKANKCVDIIPEKAGNDPVLRRCPDITKAKEKLAYKPKVCLSEGLDLTLGWYMRAIAC